MRRGSGKTPESGPSKIFAESGWGQAIRFWFLDPAVQKPNLLSRVAKSKKKQGIFSVPLLGYDFF